MTIYDTTGYPETMIDLIGILKLPVKLQLF